MNALDYAIKLKSEGHKVILDNGRFKVRFQDEVVASYFAGMASRFGLNWAADSNRLEFWNA